MEDYIAQIAERLKNEGVKISGPVKISEDGSTLIYGRFFKECALIFTRQDEWWVFQQKLTASDGTANDYFGASVSISCDGTTALIGAYQAASSGISYTGAAYVFTRSGSTWTQQQKLTASDGDTNDNFGIYVSLSSDSNMVLVFNRYNKKYVFTPVDGKWVETASIQGPCLPVCA